MAVAIIGKTYPVRYQLRELGGEWDAKQKAWLVPDDKAEEAKQLVAEAAQKAENGKKVGRLVKCKACGSMTAVP